MGSARESGDGAAVDSISLVEVWNIVRAEWLVLAVSVGVSSIIAVAFALLMTPVYRAQAAVVPVDPNNRDTSASALLGQLGTLAGVPGANIGRVHFGVKEGSRHHPVAIPHRGIHPPQRPDPRPVCGQGQFGAGGESRRFGTQSRISRIGSALESIRRRAHHGARRMD